MSTAEVLSIAVAVLIPVVTAVLGALGLAFQDWRQRRSLAGRRKFALEDAGRQVSFAVAWWNARKQLADSPEAMQEATNRAVAWLEEASALVANSQPLPSEERRPAMLRRLLLLYELHGRAARFIRGVFYVCLAALVWGLGTTISEALTRSRTLGEGVGFLIFTAILSLSFRFLVAAAEPQVSEGETGHRITIRRWLLLYRFHGLTARVVRAVFYVWLAGTVLVTAFNFATLPLYPTDLPEYVGMSVALIGLAVALRYWAASLEAAHRRRRARRTRASDAATEKPQTSVVAHQEYDQ